MNNGRVVQHWFDFLCPFCYVGQSRTDVLRRGGCSVVERPLQAHPDIPPGGLDVGPRVGEMYYRLEQEARDAGLILIWPSHLPDTRVPLAAAEWARQHASAESVGLNRSLFEAHFAFGEDIGDLAIVDRCARQQGIDLRTLHAALDDGSAAAGVERNRAFAQEVGVQGTPAWLIDGTLVSGLKSIAYFEHLAHAAFGDA